MPPLSDCFAHSCPLSDANLKHSLIHTHYHSPPHICIFSHIHLHTYTHFPSNMHSLSHCPSPSRLHSYVNATYLWLWSDIHSQTLTFTFRRSHKVMLTPLTCDSGLAYTHFHIPSISHSYVNTTHLWLWSDIQEIEPVNICLDAGFLSLVPKYTRVSTLWKLCVLVV